MFDHTHHKKIFLRLNGVFCGLVCAHCLLSCQWPSTEKSLALSSLLKYTLYHVSLQMGKILLSIFFSRINISLSMSSYTECSSYLIIHHLPLNSFCYVQVPCTGEFCTWTRCSRYVSPALSREQDLPEAFFLMQLRMMLSFPARRAHCWLMFNGLFIRILESLCAELLSSQLPPSLCFARGYCCEDAGLAISFAELNGVPFGPFLQAYQGPFGW